MYQVSKHRWIDRGWTCMCVYVRIVSGGWGVACKAHLQGLISKRTKWSIHTQATPQLNPVEIICSLQRNYWHLPPLSLKCVCVRGRGWGGVLPLTADSKRPYVPVRVCVSAGAGCTASWAEGCSVQAWGTSSWLFPQQPITGFSIASPAATCTRACGATACRGNASHTLTALVSVDDWESTNFTIVH